MRLFTHTVTIRLRDTDAAGVLFFARQFDLIHDAYEAFLDSLGFGVPRLLQEADYHLAIVHAESDYKAPIHIGDVLTIRLKVEQVRARPFVIAYEIVNQKDAVVGSARTAHVAIDAKTRQPMDLPQDLQSALSEK